MPRFLSFSISNFKGAASVKLDLAKKIDSPVITLIGLNESGKTTILEALSHFITGDSAVSSLFGRPQTRSAAAQSLIPIHRKAAFTDQIAVSAEVLLDDADYQAAAKIGRTLKRDIPKESFPKQITVSRSYEFEDSVLKETKNYWDFKFKARGHRGKKEKTLEGPDEANPLWSEVVDVLRDRLPRIAYFPTFLVDLPSKIYLAEYEGESATNRYYRSVLQDVLDSIGEGLELEKHVVKRIQAYKETQGTPFWINMLFGGTSRGPIDSVFQKISNAVTKHVLGSWQKVFQRPIAAKSISLEWQIDTENKELPYARFFVSDGESKYQISERSLGFRWFFSFLLFTAFKQAGSRSTLFAFDEPAANLHAKAQAELLKSFSRIVQGGNRVVYSTHSHHMINPRWLSGAYIVENKAIDYESEESFELSATPTDIVAVPYRNFVGQHPARTTYFQPVIEKLEYVPPEIVGTAPYLIVEGITDFYALKLAQFMSKSSPPFSIAPGTGASSSGALINLLLGRGERFFVLLDDDATGRAAADRYKKEWFLPENVVQTLGQLDPKFKGKKLEHLISAATKKLIQARFSKAKEPTKKEIGLYLSEMYALGGPTGTLSAETITDLLEVLRIVGERLTKS